MKREQETAATSDTPSITFILPNLSGGGAERVALNLANHWSQHHIPVDLVLLDASGVLLDLLDPRINVVNLKQQRILSSILPLSRYLISHKPKVIWVAMWPLTTAVILAWLIAGRPGKLFTTDHTDFTSTCRYEIVIPPSLARLAIRMSYSFASACVVVSHGLASEYARITRLPPSKLNVIYNPVLTSRAYPLQQASTSSKRQLWGGDYDFHILSVGSLKAQKNHSLLITAFSYLLNLGFNAKLTIVGEGDLRSQLEHQVSTLNLSARISLPGFFLDPSPWYRTSDMFVLSSSWEGFGNVLVEALSYDLPIVSTDCPSGPSEILQNGKYGSLVPPHDPASLCTSMASTLLHGRHINPSNRLFRANHFTVSAVARQYQNLFYSRGASFY